MMKKRLDLIIILSICGLLLTGCVSSNNSYVAPVVNNSSRQLHHIPRTAYYKVHKGDTLYSVAWSVSMDFRDLARINHLQAPYTLHPGQRLRMYGRTPHTYAAVNNNVTRRSATRTAWFGRPTNRFNNSPTQKRAHYVPAEKTSTTTAVTASITPIKSWNWPTKGKVVRGYSPSVTGNKGLDITGNYGQAVVAVAPGKVVYRGSGMRGYGNLIIIKHNDNYLSAYGHNKQLLVSEGAVVKGGQKIAEMGKADTGQVLLHFEIRYHGKPVNPLNYLSRSIALN